MNATNLFNIILESLSLHNKIWTKIFFFYVFIYKIFRLRQESAFVIKLNIYIWHLRFFFSICWSGLALPIQKFAAHLTQEISKKKKGNWNSNLKIIQVLITQKTQQTKYKYFFIFITKSLLIQHYNKYQIKKLQ